MSRLVATVLLVSSLALAAACGGTTPAGGGGSGSVPTPTDGSPSAAGGQAPDNAGGEQPAGNIPAVTIADALYQSGSAHVEVSGGKQLTFDAQLVPGASMTTGGGTLLLYSVGEGENTSVFSIANGGDGGMGFTITAPGVFTGSDVASGCPIELTKNDASGIEGRFDCGGVSTVGLDQATVSVKATFSAVP